MLIQRLAGPGSDFILQACAHQYAQAPLTAGNLFFFITRLTSVGALETYDAADQTWKATGLTYSGANPAYGVLATHRKENGGSPGVNTGIWTAVVPGSAFDDAVRYFFRFSGQPHTAFYKVDEFELGS